MLVGAIKLTKVNAEKCRHSRVNTLKGALSTINGKAPSARRRSSSLSCARFVSAPYRAKYRLKRAQLMKDRKHWLNGIKRFKTMKLRGVLDSKSCAKGIEHFRQKANANNKAWVTWRTKCIKNHPAD